ncbi:MAG TPA: GFA family protein [Nordella sp.]|nr:GFA family protein [Nordella sp.]
METSAPVSALPLPAFPIAGGCVCTVVRYRLHGPPLSVYACHCKDCQRFSGGPFSVAMAVRRADFSVDRGHPARLAKPADSGRVVGVRFCRDCGTRLWHEPAHSPHLVNIAAGTLDDSAWAMPAAHVWTSRQAPWVHFTPATYFSCAAQPDAREPLYEAWKKATSL